VTLTPFALRNGRLTVVLILAILAWGLVTYLTFPSREDPEITIREAIVTASFPGMAPERVENLIARRIEEKVREIPEVKHITSTSRTGQAVVHATVDDRYFDLEPIWQDLRNRMEDVQADLPDGTAGPFVNDDFGLVSVATVAVTGDGFSLAEMRDVARHVRDRLYSVRGVKRIELAGIQEERVFIEVSNARLAQYDIAPSQLVATLRQQNIVLPGGRVDTGGPSISIEPSGDFSGVGDIRDVILDLPGTDRGIYLRDIATIRRAYVDPPQEPVYFNGEPAVLLGVSMIAGENVIEFGDRLAARVAALEATLPVGYRLAFATFQPEVVATAIDGFTSNLYQTLAIVLGVVVLFLGLRTGLIVGTMVPLAMLLAVIVMRQSGIELQRVSIAALIIALGMLVDNGIVTAEYIKTRMLVGDDRRHAAETAGRELAIPLLTSSVTTILAFVPLMLADHVAGEFTRSLSLVILITLLGSWLLAQTVTPFLCAHFIKFPGSAQTGSAQTDAQLYGGRFYRAYQGLLEGILRLRVPFMLLMLGLFAAAIYGMQFVPKIFFPPSDRTQLMVYLDLPAGYGSRAMDRSVRDFAGWLSSDAAPADVERSVAYVGNGGLRFVLAVNPFDPAPNRAFVLIDLVEGGNVDGVRRALQEHLIVAHPELRAQVKRMWLGPAEAGLVELRIVGPDASVLFERARQVEVAMREVPGTVDLRTDWENRILKLVVQVDQARARRADVTSEDIATSLNAFLDGSTVTDYREGDTSIPVVLRADAEDRFNLDRVRTVNVFSAATGRNVPLLQIADFRPVFEYSQIRRRDLERTITVSAKNDGMVAADFAKRLLPAVESLDLPPGHHWEWGGELEKSSEAQAALFAHLPLAFLAMAIILIGQFNSFRRPLIIALTIPLTLIGAAAGLLATGATFGFMAILGLLSLAGIVINNAIILLDRIEQSRGGGAAAYDAVVGAAISRLRPILMTTLTTVLGLLPLLAFGGELWFGMAVVIVFGLFVGTVLTLGVVPVLYTWLFRVTVPRDRRFSWSGSSGAPVATPG